MGHGNARHGRQATPLAHNLSRAALGPVSVPSVARGSGLAVAIMINIPVGARVLLGTRPIDFGKGAHSLAALAQEVLAEDPFFGAVNVYRAKCSDRQKILVWDTSGHAAKRRVGRGALRAAHLPRIEVTLAPENTACPCCRASDSLPMVAPARAAGAEM